MPVCGAEISADGRIEYSSAIWCTEDRCPAYLTTESLAVFIPFRVQEIYHENGVYYGQNVISKNMIIANRRQLLNGNSFILGVSGAGKSFTAKEEMTNIILTTLMPI